MIPMTDQWKRTGNCELCRKKSYCHNPCRANKRRKESMVRDAVEKAMAKVMPAYMGVSSMKALEKRFFTQKKKESKAAKT